MAGLREVVSDFAGPSRKLLIHGLDNELLFEVRALSRALTPEVLALLEQLAPIPVEEPAPPRVLPFKRPAVK